MPALTTSLLPPKLNPHSLSQHPSSVFLYTSTSSNNNNQYSIVSRLFGQAIFEASKLRVIFSGVDEKEHPSKLPRTYTLTHCDITSKLTLAISQTINNSQLKGWYNKLQRDEVVGEWKKVKGKMSLHVHCHISGGHFLLDLFARLRFFIFCKELPVVLKAFVHGDGNLLKNYPELEEALVWVYFHSNIPQYNKVECWGPLKEAPLNRIGKKQQEERGNRERIPQSCQGPCNCCLTPMSFINWDPQGGPSGTQKTCNGRPENTIDLDPCSQI